MHFFSGEMLFIILKYCAAFLMYSLVIRVSWKTNVLFDVMSSATSLQQVSTARLTDILFLDVKKRCLNDTLVRPRSATSMR